MLVLSSLVLGFAMLDAFSGFVVVWLHPMPMRPYLDVTIWDALPWCQLLHAYLSPFPFHAMICLPCLFAPPIGFLCFFTCLLVCHPCFNTMKLWTSDPNLHLSRAPPFVCFLVCLFAFLLVCLLSYFLVVAKIESANNLADPFTKTLPQRTFKSHLEGMRVRLVHNSL